MLEEARDIREYCLGRPELVAHSGGIRLHVCVQEDAIYLPTVRTRRRRQHQSTAGGGGGGSGSDHGAGTNENDLVSVEETNGVQQQTGNESLVTTRTTTNGSTTSGAQPTTTATTTTNGTTATSTGTTSGTTNGATNGATNGTTSGTNSTTNETTRTSSSTTTSTNNDPDSGFATLRGSIFLEISKPTKIRSISVAFMCVSSTLWNLLPQSSLLNDHAYHNSAQVEDTAYLGAHYFDFVPLEQFAPAQGAYNKTCGALGGTLIGQDLYGADVAEIGGKVRRREFHRLANSRGARLGAGGVPVFSVLTSPPRKLRASGVHADGVLFPAGKFVYHFTLLVDAATPGAAFLSNGQMRFALSAKVHRASAFAFNVQGQRQVEVVHLPPASLEPGGAGGPQQDQVLVSRVWEQMFMYYISLEHRSIALDSPARLSVLLMPMQRPDVRVHRLLVYINEIATYVYSLDPAIKYVDPTLKLPLAQRAAPQDGSLLDGGGPAQLDIDFMLVSEHNEARADHPDSYARGRYGELRYLAPDVKGPYIRVKHRLQLVFHVSHAGTLGPGGQPLPGVPEDAPRSHYEVKFETRVYVLSRLCVPEALSLPTYLPTDVEITPVEPPPPFDQALGDPVLGAAPPARGTKAEIEHVE